jgi:uncharacterized protein (UPF0276 family)
MSNSARVETGGRSGRATRERDGTQSARHLRGAAVSVCDRESSGHVLHRDHALLDFIARISREADCAIVLDIGHLLGYQYATGRAPGDMPLDRFPFERVIEIHLVGLERSVSGAHVCYLDQHGAAVTEPCWQLLRELLPRMRNLKDLTLEQEFCEDELVRQHLKRARHLVRELGVLQWTCASNTRLLRR